MENREEKLLTVKEVAEMLNITTTTVHNMIRSGRMPYRDLSKGQNKRKRILRFQPSKVKAAFNL